ncbi:unnamed protein product [Penicillium bialowiezense]
MEDLPTNIHPSMPNYQSPILGFCPTPVTASDESEHSLDDCGPSTPTHDLDSSDGHAGVRIVKPYAIEEPEEDDEPVTPTRNLLRLPDQFERWQRDLSEYMNDLNYEADGQHVAPSTARKQGHKRKLTHAARQNYTRPVQEQCPKKRRSNANSPITDPFHAFRESISDESSCSEQRSADCSGMDTGNDSPDVDYMDID